MMGSDLFPGLPDLNELDRPYTGDKQALIPALNPDVAILHTQRCDPYGNVRNEGLPFMDEDIAISQGLEVVIDMIPGKTGLINHSSAFGATIFVRAMRVGLGFIHKFINLKLPNIAKLLKVSNVALYFTGYGIPNLLYSHVLENIE